MMIWLPRGAILSTFVFFAVGSAAWASAFENPVPNTKSGNQFYGIFGSQTDRDVSIASEDLRLSVVRGRLEYGYGLTDNDQVGAFGSTIDFSLNLKKVDPAAKSAKPQSSASGSEIGVFGRRLLSRGDTISQGLLYQVSAANGSGSDYKIDFVWADVAYGASYELTARWRLYAAAFYGYAGGTIKPDQGKQESVTTTSNLGILWRRVPSRQLDYPWR